ncbi:MAG: hypothetical protein M3Q37_09100 [Gemmatimonadota bacterium]|nr:hypothetical protein [Gemmatimonadota bacterium]
MALPLVQTGMTDAQGYLGMTHGKLERGDVRFNFRTDAKGFRNTDAWPDTAEVVAVGDCLHPGA